MMMMMMHATDGIARVSVGNVRKPRKNGWTNRDAVWRADTGIPKEAWIRQRSRSDEFIRAARGDKTVMRPFVKILSPLIIIIVVVVVIVITIDGRFSKAN